MNKYFITFIFLILTRVGLSQNLSNYNFEDWSFFNSFENPDYWSTSNFSVFSVVSFNPVTKELNDVYDGSYSLKLVTTEKNISGENIKVAGLVTLGNFDIDISTRKAIVNGGVQIKEKPSEFSGYFKYSTSGTDSCIMSIFLTKFNLETQVRDTVGIGLFTSSNQPQWSQFKTNILYNSTIEPDSMNIVIMSSDTSIFDSGSTLLIDNLFIDGLVSNVDQILENDLKIFPNPAKDFINIESKTSNTYFIRFYNSIGVNVKSIYFMGSKQIDISDLNAGLYFINITIKNKTLTQSLIIK